MHCKRPHRRFLATALSPWQSSRTGEECTHLKWGWYVNAVKLHGHSSQNMADFALGNEVWRQKGAGYLSPAHVCERGAYLQAGCAWSGKQRERDARSPLMPSELPCCQAEQSKGTGAKCGLLFLCRLRQILCLSLCLCFLVWIWGIPM